MCNYKTWYYKEKTGYVIECEQCRKIQVGFGTVLLTMTIEDLNTFREFLIEYNRKTCSPAEPGIKRFFIPTSCAGISLLLNKNELTDLCNMLENADNEMRAAQL